MPALTQTTVEGAILEVASLLSEAESLLTTPTNNIQIAADFESQRVRITGQLPFVSSGAGNQIELNISDYAPVAGFTAGSVPAIADGATLTNAAATLARLCEAGNRLEEAKRLAGGTIPTGVNIGFQLDMDNFVLSVDVNLAFTVSLSGGKPVLAASEYLN